MGISQEYYFDHSSVLSMMFLGSARVIAKKHLVID